LGDQQDRAGKADQERQRLTAQLEQANKDLAAQKAIADKPVTEVERQNGELKIPHAEVEPTPIALPAISPRPDPIDTTTTPRSSSDETTWTVDQRRAAQTNLIALGHMRGTADGNFGAATRTAIKQFQAFAGTSETGILTEDESRSLNNIAKRLGALLARGQTSPDGVAADTVKGAQARFARAWAADKVSGEKPDPSEAVYWYGLAATDNEAKAFTNLGILLVRGVGTSKPDPDSAAVLWWSAAARGEANAMFNLGALWEQGIGVTSDIDKAKAWYQRAAVRGYPQAQAALKRLGA